MGLGVGCCKEDTCFVFEWKPLVVVCGLSDEVDKLVAFDDVHIYDS
jgi:hypothetical protein